MVQVGNQPGIERVRIVSKPQFDSDGDGTDRHLHQRLASILIDVEFNEPVKVTGTATNYLSHVRMRIEVGSGFDVLRLDRSPGLLHGGKTMRFKYEQVFAGDSDSDGIRVLTRTVADKLRTRL